MMRPTNLQAKARETVPQVDGLAAHLDIKSKYLKDNGSFCASGSSRRPTGRARRAIFQQKNTPGAVCAKTPIIF